MLKIKSSLFLLVTLINAGAIAGEHGKYNIGTVVDESVYKSWVINVQPDSKHLPDGEGSVEQGSEIYAKQCSFCHGDKGQGIKWQPTNAAFPKLIGQDHDPKNGKNIGSYWPYASTLYDYINRAMPITTPGSLSSDQVYALVAFLLHSNGIIENDVIVSAENLNKIEMPNQNGFECDNRPTATGDLCMKNCKTPRDNDFNLDGGASALSQIAPVPVTDCYLN